MLQHNRYFDGLVQSVGFERNGRRYTAGVFDVGAFHFNTDTPERMTVISGELRVNSDGHGVCTDCAYCAGRGTITVEVAA